MSTETERRYRCPTPGYAVSTPWGLVAAGRDGVLTVAGETAEWVQERVHDGRLGRLQPCEDAAQAEQTDSPVVGRRRTRRLSVAAPLAQPERRTGNNKARTPSKRVTPSKKRCRFTAPARAFSALTPRGTRAATAASS